MKGQSADPPEIGLDQTTQNNIEQAFDNKISLSFGTSTLDAEDMAAWVEWIKSAPSSASEFLDLSVTTFPPRSSRKRTRSEMESEPGPEQ